MLDIKKAKILMVDDSVVARMAVKKMLLGEVGTIEEAASGTLALDMLDKSIYDCVLMDYLMPGLNGMTVLKIIRERKNFTPVVIISANQQENILNKFYELKVSAVLKKHVNKTELIAAIGLAINSKKEL